MFGISSTEGYSVVANGIDVKTIVYGSQTLMTEFRMKKGAILPEHAHHQEQTGYLVKGRIRLHIGGHEKEIRPGDSWNIPSNVKHKAEILEDSVAIEVFAPVREDYMKYVLEKDILF